MGLGSLRFWIFGAAAVLILMACGGRVEESIAGQILVSPEAIAADVSPTATAVPQPTATPSATLTPVPTATTGLLPPTDTPLPPTMTSTLPATRTPLPTVPSPTPDPNVRPDTPTPGLRVSMAVQHACPRRESCIFSPQFDDVVSGVVPIRGSARRGGFEYYKIEYQLEGASDWTFFKVFNASVLFGLLASWPTTDVPSGAYWLRLVVVDINGNYWPEETKIRLLVVNEPTVVPKDPFEALRYNPTATPTPSTGE